MRCSASFRARSGVGDGEHLDDEQAGVLGPVDGDGGHRDALGHLHGGVERVDAVEGAARQRHADHRQGGVGGHRAGEVGRQPGAADERAVALLASGRRQLGHLGRGAVGRVHPHVGLDAEPLEDVGGRLHLVPVVGRAHQDGDLVASSSTRRILPSADGDVGSVVGAGPVEVAHRGVGARPGGGQVRAPADDLEDAAPGGHAAAPSSALRRPRRRARRRRRRARRRRGPGWRRPVRTAAG